MDYKRFEIVVDEWSGEKVTVEPELGLYAAYDFMGNKMPILGIQLYSYDEDGYREPYATLTTNFGEFIGAKDCAYIDTNNNSFAAQLLTMGFCQDTGFTKNSGFCVYPLWKFDKDFLKAIDVHGLYDVYEKKFDEYMEEGAKLPLCDRELEVLQEVLASVKAVDVVVEETNGEIIAYEYGKQYHGAEFYRYLLAEVCEYDENGAVKGLDLDLCNDFYDLCEHNEVNYKDYNKPKVQKNTEFVITMSSGGGTVRDFLTCSSREEAEDVCESYDWRFVDENAFEWSLDIDEREVSLIGVEESKETKNMCVYEVQLGKMADGAKNENIDYDSPQIILIEADHYIEIEEIEKTFNKEIETFDCDCVYGITPLEDWELNEYECYKTTPKFKLCGDMKANDYSLETKLADAKERSANTGAKESGKDEFVKE